MADESMEFLTVGQVAARLQYKPETIQGWLRSGRLSGKKVGHEWRIPAGEVAALLGVDQRPSEEGGK